MLYDGIINRAILTFPQCNLACIGTFQFSGHNFQRAHHHSHTGAHSLHHISLAYMGTDSGFLKIQAHIWYDQSPYHTGIVSGFGKYGCNLDHNDPEHIPLHTLNQSSPVRKHICHQ